MEQRRKPKTYVDKQVRKARKKAGRKLKRQLTEADRRARYGPKGKPAPVTVRSMATGEVVKVESQGALTKQFAAKDQHREPKDWIAERFPHLGFKSYGAYLRSAHWRHVRLRWVEAGRSLRCYVCGKEGCQLHHRTYDRLGGEKLNDLVPLCQGHHQSVHWLVRRKGVPLYWAHERLLAMEEQADRDIESAFDEAA